MGPVTIGLKVGQRMEATGIAVAEQGQRVEGGWVVDTFTIRFLQRLPPGTAYPAVATRLGETVRRVVALAGGQDGGGPPPVAIYADVTALGDPVVAVLRESGFDLIPVYMTHGDKRIVQQTGEVTLGKAWIVARLQALLQTGRLHLPRTPEAETLARELIDYQIDAGQVDNAREGAFSVGSQDDLVSALGLATEGFPEADTTEIVWLEDIIGDRRVHIGGDESYQTPHQQMLADWRRYFDDRY